jgi:transposase
MSTQSLLPDPSVLTLQGITVQDGVIVFSIQTTSQASACPDCGHFARRVHSRYGRTLSDLPWQGIPVRFRLRVRKLFCDNPQCHRRIFAQRIPTVACRYSRKTLRLTDALHLLAYRLGGEAGAKAARRLGMLLSSPDTLLRQLRRNAATSAAAVRVLGVDDFALRRGQSYGTILVDLERRRPVDLLPDRTAQALEKWLLAHPGVELISRDRAGAYAEGADKGAPDALQVADRWHLAKNVTDTLEAVLGRERRALKEAATQAHRQTTTPPPPPLPDYDERVKTQNRARRLARFERMQVLVRQAEQGCPGGSTRKEAAQAAGISRATFYRWLSRNTFPERKPLPRRDRLVDPFAPYLRDRWEQGCHNGAALFQEIAAQGFTGTYTMVIYFLKDWREEWKQQRATEPERVPSPRQATWLLLRPREKLNQSQQCLVEALIRLCPAAQQARQLTLSFFTLVRGRDTAGLEAWLTRARESQLPEMERCAKGMERDKSAILASLSHPWSNGQTEGQVGRLKLVKRQMYGRAGLDLLRARVLPQASA